MNLLFDYEGRRQFGARPFAVWNFKDGAWTWNCSRNDFPLRDARANSPGDALTEIRRALRWSRERFPSGAAAGFFAYDFARRLEPRAFANSPSDDLQLPDARLEFYENWKSEEIRGAKSTPEIRRTFSVFQDATGDENYARDLNTILDFIRAGDIYQANLTRRFEAALNGTPAELYAKLRAHPMPFSALLEWDDFSIVSNSPERFIRVENGVVTAQPIKGTMRRGRDAVEDALLMESLRSSPKERAENVMIVDLLRNDLGRVCEFGSVQVPQLFGVKTFPTLHHLVSTVTGKLKDNYDAIDAFGAAFPCGSISGAPKIRAMQILDELEPVRRGLAMGALGYFKFDGDADWNVAIRTVTCVKNRAYFHVGGGIVADSDAPREAEEIALKAQAISAALS